MVLVPYDQARANSDFSNNFRQSGGINVYAGGEIQKGHGIGNILTGLFQRAVPLLKKGAASLGKTAIQTGVNVLNDGLQGKNLKASLKQNAKQAGNQILTNAINSVTGQSQTNRRNISAPTRSYRNKPQSQTNRRDFSTPTMSYRNKSNKKRKRVTMTVSRSSPPKRRRTKNRQADIFG